MFEQGLSVCIIAKNEAKMLNDCLRSIYTIANEIILVDTGSTDNTVQIAQSFNCRIIKSVWKEDFSAARNIALEEAKYEFILSIDADERLINPQQVHNIINHANLKVGGWLVDVISESKNENNTTDHFVNKQIRIFRNHQDIRFYGIIHEQIVSKIVQLNLKIIDSGIKFQHLGYNLNTSDKESKHKRNLKLLNKAISLSEDAVLYYQRAKTFLALGDLINAEEDISQALKHIQPSNLMFPQILNYASIISFKSNRLKEAKYFAEKSIELIPNQTFANLLLAEINFNDNNFLKALNYYIKSENSYINSDLLSQIHGEYHLSPEELYFKIGKCHLLLEDYFNAKVNFEKGLSKNQNHVFCLIGLANAEFKLQNFEKTEILLFTALKLHPENSQIIKFFEEFKASKNTILIQKSHEIENINITPKQDKPKISLSMIVKNEEKFIGGCLESIKNVVDEIIIVDTGSTDKTIEIAKNYGAQIYYYQWNDDFSAARNESLRHCNGDWILYLDADERFCNSKIELYNHLNNSNSLIGALLCIIESEHRKPDNSTEMHKSSYPRIFRNFGFPNIRFTGKVHEQITPSIFALGYQQFQTNLKIEHLGYSQNLETIESKAKRNYKMLMDQVKEDPLNGYAWFQLGQTLGFLNMMEESVNAMKFALKCGNLSDSIKASLTASLSQKSGNDKNFNDALYWAQESIKLAPDNLYAQNLLAHSLLYLNKFEESEKVFENILIKLENNKNISSSGLEIEVPKDIVIKGLNEAKQKINVSL